VNGRNLKEDRLWREKESYIIVVVEPQGISVLVSLPEKHMQLYLKYIEYTLALKGLCHG
jgi:hypothetical protein